MITRKDFLQRKDGIYWLMAIYFLFRSIIAFTTNLGNDEVYYYSYALYPDWSFYDHPPMVGLLIRLTTLNLHFNSEFFVRLGPLLLGTLNLYLIYQIGIVIKDRITGLTAAILLSASFYGSVIVGTFILPDTPQSSFWLLSILCFIKYMSDKKSQYFLILFGVCAGLALLSKYHAVFLWFGAMAYLILFDRKVLLNPILWLSVLLSILIFSPVIFWNLSNEYSGIGYHAGRVGINSMLPTLKYFFPEFFGQIFYNNPFNVTLILLSLIILFKQRKTLFNPTLGFLLSIGLPLILVTLGMSLYNRTLPHWSGPSYYSLILIAAYIYRTNDPQLAGKTLMRLLTYGQLCFLVVFLVTLFQIKTGALVGNSNLEPERLGKDDFTIDLSMWDEISTAIKSKITNDVGAGNVNQNHIILTHNWFPAAHLDYYYALPNHTKLYVSGKPENQHHYTRINDLRGEIPVGTDSYYITTSHYYRPPDKNLLNHFENVIGPDIIPVFKKNRKKVNVFIWRMNNLQEKLILN